MQYAYQFCHFTEVQSYFQEYVVKYPLDDEMFGQICRIQQNKHFTFWADSLVAIS